MAVENGLKRKIYAVHDGDLESFLNDLNVLDKINREQIMCQKCGCVIILENIGFFFTSDGEIKICCDNLNCFYEFKRSQMMLGGDKTQ